MKKKSKKPVKATTVPLNKVKMEPVSRRPSKYEQILKAMSAMKPDDAVVADPGKEDFSAFVNRLRSVRVNRGVTPPTGYKFIHRRGEAGKVVILLQKKAKP